MRWSRRWTCLYLSNAESSDDRGPRDFSELAATAALGELASLGGRLKGSRLIRTLARRTGAVMKTLWSNVASDECSNNRKAAALNILDDVRANEPRDRSQSSRHGVRCDRNCALAGEKKSPTLCRAACCALTVVSAARTTNRSISTIRCSAELAKVLHPAAPLDRSRVVPICGASHLRPVFAASRTPSTPSSQVIKAFAEATFAMATPYGQDPHRRARHGSYSCSVKSL